MVCPFCLHKKTSVYNSRSTAGSTKTWRRRQCLNCHGTFTTQEQFDPSGLWKIKSSNKISAYSRAALTLSILRACDHRRNQDESAWHLLETVEKMLLPVAAKNAGFLTTQDVTDAVALVLKRYDAAAYIKYLSHHHPAMDAKTLRNRLKRA